MQWSDRCQSCTPGFAPNIIPTRKRRLCCLAQAPTSTHAANTFQQWSTKRDLLGVGVHETLWQDRLLLLLGIASNAVVWPCMHDIVWPALRQRNNQYLGRSDLTDIVKMPKVLHRMSNVAI